MLNEKSLKNKGSLYHIFIKMTCINNIMELGTITAKVINPATKECIVVSSYKQYTSIIRGICFDISLTVLPFERGHIKCNKMVFGNKESFFTLYENIVYSIEHDDLGRQLKLLTGKWDFKNSVPRDYDTMVNDCLVETISKVHVGYKAKLLTFNKCVIEVVDQGDVFVYEKYFPKHIESGFTDKGTVWFKLGESEFLKYMLDDQYVDITTLLSPEQALFEITNFRNFLEKKSGFKDITRY